MKNNLKKDFFWNTIGVTLNAFTSLFFLIFVTRINGTDIAGVFTFAFSTALIIQVFGYYNGRVFQVTEQNKEITDSDYLYTHIITSLLMIIIGFVFCLIRNYEITKIVIMMLLILFRSIESFADSVYAVIQKNNSLYKVGISFTLKSIISILLFLIVDILTKNIYLAILMIILSQTIILWLYDLKNLKEYMSKLLTFNSNNIKYIFKTGFYTFLFTFLTQYVINAPKYAIDSYLTNNDQTIYGIISMPATAMFLLGQFLIHPFIVKLTNYLKSNDIKSFNKSIIKLILILIGFGIVGVIAAYLIGIPFLNIIYSVNLNNYRNELSIIILGSIFLSMVTLLSNALIAMRKTFGQTVIYGIVSFFTLFACNYLIKKEAIFGASISYLLTYILLFSLYFIYYIINIKKYKNVI